VFVSGGESVFLANRNAGTLPWYEYIATQLFDIPFVGVLWSPILLTAVWRQSQCNWTARKQLLFIDDNDNLLKESAKKKIQFIKSWYTNNHGGIIFIVTEVNGINSAN
jgi:hypothetical protein